MRTQSSLLAAVCLALPLSLANPLPDPNLPNHPRSSSRLFPRNIVYDGQIASSYDFVIVGGGTAGLVLAARLSEDANTTVLVLEAGDTGDAVRETIDTPSDAYYAGLLGTSYDWAFSTVPQVNAGNRTLTWPRGKLLGGSSAVNGLYAVRPSQLEYDTWSSMLGGQDGASAWAWPSQLSALKKAETFSPPASDLASANDLQFSTDSHGTDGPVHMSWPGYMLPLVSTWAPTLSAAGVPPSPDPYAGQTAGAFVALSAINPANWTRSYARSAYIDPLPPRPNLAILPNATVTRVLFDSTTNTTSLKATGVEWAVSAAAPRQTIRVTKEVLLAAGALGSPHVLMHSGLGAPDVLASAGVPLLYALPGVGQHLQDHVSTGISWTTSADTAASLRASGAGAGAGSGLSSAFLSFVNGAEAYVNLSALLGGPEPAAAFAQNVTSALDAYASAVVPSTYAPVLAGYRAIYNATAAAFLPSALAHVELLLSAQGQPGSAQQQTVQIQAALQHPLSQGHVWIAAADAFAGPRIDPSYLSHAADVAALREALKLARRVAQTPPLAAYLDVEVSPGPGVQTDAEWEDWLRASVGTEYHPATTCAMLPEQEGGVVDAKLRVYGTQNVRVVDASVFPVAFAAHLQMAVYALAETAAEIVRAHANGLPEPGSSSTSTATTPTPSSTSAPGGGKKNAALRAYSCPCSRRGAAGAGAMGALTVLLGLVL